MTLEENILLAKLAGIDYEIMTFTETGRKEVHWIRHDSDSDEIWNPAENAAQEKEVRKAGFEKGVYEIIHVRKDEVILANDTGFDALDYISSGPTFITALLKVPGLEELVKGEV